MNKHFFAAVILFFAPVIFAGVNGNAGIIFPEIIAGAGARAEAMAGAFVSLADDASAVYWNPAGLSGIDNIKVSAAFDKWFMDSFYQNVMAAFPMGPGVLGLDIFYMSYGAFDRVNDSGVLTGGSVNPYSLSVMGGYGISFGKEFSAGLTARFALQAIDTTSVTGLSFDLGTRYKTKFFAAGFAIKNIGTAGEYSMPLQFKAGASIPLLSVKDHRFTFAADADYFLKDTAYASAGAEYSFSKLFSVRAGYRFGFGGNNTGSFSGFTAGAGAGIGNFSLDYALVPYGSLGITHRATLNMEFAVPNQEVEMLKPAKRKTEKPDGKEAKSAKELYDMLAAGGSYENNGNLDAAEKQYRAILDEDFNYAQAWKRLGAVMVKKKNNVEAFRCFQQYLKLKPDDKAVKAWIEKNSRE